MSTELKYKISRVPPPCYAAAQAKFGVNFFRDGVVFTYGDTIHVYKGGLTPDLVVHESMHIQQQKHYRGGAQGWWMDYIRDPEFRLEQELQAYRAQWNYVKTYYKKNTHPHHLNFFAKSLCMVYKLPGMDIEKATALITQS